MLFTPAEEKLCYQAVNQEVLDCVPRSAKRVLDIGCGTGDLGKLLKDRNGAEVVGVTYSEAEAVRARKVLDEVLVVDLNGPISWELGQFDCIICSHVLEHLYWPEKVVQVASSLLTDEGTLVVALPNLLYWKQRLKLLRGQFRYTDGGIMDRTHFRFFDAVTAKNLVESGGLRVSRQVTTTHCPGSGKLGAFGAVLNRTVGNLLPGLFGVQFVFVAKRPN